MLKTSPSVTLVQRPVPDRASPTPEPAYRAFGSSSELTLEEGLDQLADAIRDPTRRRILVGFYSDPRPRTANDVADDVGVSRPVARTHLELLRATGFLRHEPRRGFRGKPAHLYTLDTGSPNWMPHPPRQMALLALLVLEAASLGPERVQRLIEQVGQDYGTAILEFRRLDDRPGDLDAALAPLRLLGETVTVQPLGRTGRETRLELRDLIFTDACPGRADLLASLHLGIVRSLVEELGLTVLPDPEPPGGADAIRLLIRTGPARRR